MFLPRMAGDSPMRKILTGSSTMICYLTLMQRDLESVFCYGYYERKLEQSTGTLFPESG